MAYSLEDLSSAISQGKFEVLEVNLDSDAEWISIRIRVDCEDTTRYLLIDIPAIPNTTFQVQRITTRSERAIARFQSLRSNTLDNEEVE